MATGLAKAGADIAILDVSKDNADARAKSIATLGREAIGVVCDASNPPEDIVAVDRKFWLLNVFGIKMAGVFMFSTCTIALRTAIFPRWLAFSGFGCGLVLVIGITNWQWIALIFPAWMLLVGAQRTGLYVSWYQYRGPAKVTFDFRRSRFA
jgi:hypothetical protein